jgi:hypothetical protein
MFPVDQYKIRHSGGKELPPLPEINIRKIRQTNNQQEEHKFY